LARDRFAERRRGDLQRQLLIYWPIFDEEVP
jgi:hypothetical protein